ncbi:MAG: glycine-rich domain-containing protein [Bacteroidia bacterium]
MLFFVFLVFAGWEAFGQTQTRTFNNSSESPYVVPHKITSIQVQIWGAGGGGGWTNNSRGAGGGGGGAYLQANTFTVAPGANVSVVIGAGGVGQSNGVAAGTGGVSSFGPLSVNGCSGAIGQTSGNGGVAGTGSYFYAAGGTSTNNTGGNNTPGMGGAAAGSSGGIGLGATDINGAIGQNGAGNGGNGGVGSNPGGVGTAGNQPGGGGGGEGRDAVNGGNGGNGQVIVSWTCSNTLVAGPQPACINLPITPIEYDIAGATGATFSGLPAGVTGTYSAGDVTISGTPTVSGSFTYTITPTGSCTGSTVTGTIVVSPNNTSGTISSNAFCALSPLPGGITQSTTGATGINTAGISGLPPGVNVAWAANQITFSGTPTTTGSFNYTIPLTGGCGTENATGTITVNAVPAITSQVSPGGTTCINGAAFGQMSVGTGFGYTYQWYVNTANSNSGGTAIPTATSNTYTPPSDAANTRYYYVVVSSPSCTSVTSPVSGAYIVTPNNTVSAASASPPTCQGSAITPITHTTTGATGIGAISWSPSNPGGTIGANLASNTLTISGSPTNPGVYAYTIPLIGGCGAISATGTITVNAIPAANATSSFATQSRCINASPGFTALSVQARTGYSYQWYRNTTGTINTAVDAPVGANTNSFTPPNDGSASSPSRYYVVVSSTTSCGTAATSSLSGDFIVNTLPIVSFVTQPPVGNYCVESDITYSTQTGESNYVWTIPGVLGTDYTITSGGNGSPSLVLKWLTIGNKSVSVNYTDAQSCGATSPATSNTITIQKNTVSPPPIISSCFTNRTITSVNQHTTTLATGIGAPTGLLPGLTASFSGNSINISGTVAASVAPGIYPYSIPLTGGCGTNVAATGFIDVQPEFIINSITSVSPSNVNGTATIRFNVDTNLFPNGLYNVSYTLGLANSGGGTALATVTNGVGLFSSIQILSENLTSLTITGIKKDTDSCFVTISQNNETFFGIRSAVYASNGTFTVPAGIFQITIKVWGGGGAGGSGPANENSAGGGGGGYSEVTIPVVPGEPIGIFIGAGGTNQGNGGSSYATRDSSLPNPQTSSLAYAFGGGGATFQARGAGGVGQTSNGLIGDPHNSSTGGQGGKGGGTNGGNGGLGGSGNGNNAGLPGVRPGGGGGGSKGNSGGGNGGAGLVLISFPLPPVGPCFKVIDDGSISGTTIIEFFCDEDITWTAPEGLVEFYTVVGGGGGGGGVGDGAGGGGAGGLVTGTVQSGNPYGFPANTSFTIRAGAGGAGAASNTAKGSNGNPSSLTGPPAYPVTFTAGGGGGGGSQNNITGGNGLLGASGGGGGANNTAEGAGGTGSGTGKTGGLGDFSTDQAFAGGGGGGIAEIGAEGKGAGLGQGEGGKGGNGISILLGDTAGDTLRYFGAGGGGVGFNFNGVKKIGFGGSAPNGLKIGGDGNITGANPIGLPGRDKTGSGGGAGNSEGGTGGNGIVYIYYFNLRILNVEYEHFTATYNPQDRSGDLSWTTSNEWETSHFEIERAVNNVNTWTKVGEVEGAGYSDVSIDYAFTDTQLPATGGNIFYRLKQVGIDGDFDYSVTRSIQVNPIKGNTSWIGYPNPSDLKSPVTVALLDVSGYTDGTIQVRISDIRGVFTTYSVSSPDAVSDVVNTHLENARPGMYIVQLLWGNQSEQLKLIKK